MIDIDFYKETYVCPYCGHAQAYNCTTHHKALVGLKSDYRFDYLSNEYKGGIFEIHSFECSNKQCGKICVTAISKLYKYQHDILPEFTYIHFPEYIPKQIRNDYEEAVSILDKSPKASATLLRRCLQGMIHDFWGIHEKNLNAEITKLKDKVSASQWKALDGLRQIGNIGAHMENDVNVIVDIDSGEAKTLKEFIELLLEKWYINRHDEEELYANITQTAEEKKEQRKNET